MAKSNTSANDYVALIYNATAVANIADNTATAPLVSLYIAAHTADPLAAGTQATSEAAFTGYARATVARAVAGFTCANGVVTLVADASFGACTAGSSLVTHWSTGVAATGATKVLHRGVFGSRQGAFTAIVTGNVVTIPGHTLAVNDSVAFYQPSGAVFPGGLTVGLVYFVKTVSVNDITVALTSGGAAVAIAAPGDGLAFRVTPLAISAGITQKLGAGAVIYEE